MKELLKAILDDDIEEVTQLLANDPSLVHQRMKGDQFQKSVPHWLYKGDTALHLCAAALRLASARLLIRRGADVNAANRRGATPLHYACDPRPRSGGVWNMGVQRRLIVLLAKHGADLNRGDEGGVTPLHRAVRARSPAAVRALLTAGAKIDCRTRPRGSAPLHLATHSTGAGGTEGSCSEQFEIVSILLDHGADPNTRDSIGRTPVDGTRNKEVRSLLMSADRRPRS
jgi:ankyrin repeat protein